MRDFMKFAAAEERPGLHPVVKAIWKVFSWIVAFGSVVLVAYLVSGR